MDELSDDLTDVMGLAEARMERAVSEPANPVEPSRQSGALVDIATGKVVALVQGWAGAAPTGQRLDTTTAAQPGQTA